MRSVLKFNVRFFIGLSVAWNAFATQPPGKNAWEELRPDSEAHVVMKKRCQSEASEEFFGTAEDVKGIFLESEDRALSYIDGSSGSYGVSFANPPYSYLRNGLSYVEYSAGLSAISRFGAKPNEQDGAFRSFDTKTRNTKVAATRSAQIRVSYKRTTSDAEEKIGVFGRLIEVTDDSRNLLLARRRDFVWLNPNRGQAHGGFVCPSLDVGEFLPISFLNKVINVKSYTCWKAFENGVRSTPNRNDSRAIDLLRSQMGACEAQYFK